jgi:hypothetical protein
MPKDSRTFGAMNVKSTFLLAGLLLVPAVTLISYPSGAPINRSGSPASNNQNCTSCHNPIGNGAESIAITSNIPADGFKPNTNYTITVTGNANGTTTPRMGFCASVEANGAHVGAVQPQTGTQKISDFITHQSSSISTANGTKSWNFTWNSGTTTGSATVYVSMLFANGNGGDSGDRTRTESATFTQSFVSQEENAAPEVAIGPNPASALTRFSFPTTSTSETLEVLDLQGRSLYRTSIEAGSSAHFLNVSDWTNGTYLVRLGDARGRLVVQH